MSMTDGSAKPGIAALTAAAARIPSPLPLRLKLIHGFGAVAFGVKDSGFSFFLLIFYNQVLGMRADLVSLALLIALLVDAVIDPIIGNLSDRTYTRWGRRLPWLYIAPIPLAMAWVLLWHPPGSGAPSFGELLGIAITVRVLLSACEVPSVSLVPELTQDYDERTTLFRYRFLAGWIGGLCMMLLAYNVFMPGAQGILQEGGYLPFGLFGAALMVISVIGSAAGQHRLVAHLPPKRPEPFTVKGAFSEITEAFSERAFLFFAAGGLAAYINQGMTFSISNYLNLFVWELSRSQLGYYPIALAISALLMFVVVGPIHARIGKPAAAARSAVIAFCVGLLPYALLFAGLWPETGTTYSMLLLYSFLIVSNCSGIVTMISATSMIAEVVESFEERTGRRAEGAFYSGNWLVQKCATGLGIFFTGQIITLSELSSEANPGSVPTSVLGEMVLLYGSATVVLGITSAWFLGRFPISRSDHEARLERLKQKKSPLDVAARGDIDAGTIVP